MCESTERYRLTRTGQSIKVTSGGRSALEQGKHMGTLLRKYFRRDYIYILLIHEGKKHLYFMLPVKTTFCLDSGNIVILEESLAVRTWDWCYNKAKTWRTQSSNSGQVQFPLQRWTFQSLALNPFGNGWCKARICEVELQLRLGTICDGLKIWMDSLCPNMSTSRAPALPSSM